MTRKLILTLSILTLTLGSHAQKKKLELDSAFGEPELTILDGHDIDLGEVHYQDSVYVKIKFKNSGKGNLLISRVRTSCSCTRVTYPEEKIPPGKEGEIGLWYIANDDIHRGYSQIRIHYNSVKSPEFVNLTAKIILD